MNVKLTPERVNEGDIIELRELFQEYKNQELKTQIEQPLNKIMSERDKVGVVKNLLQSEYHFKGKIWVEPTWSDINNRMISDILRESKIKPDLFYLNEESKFLLILEAKSEVSFHKEAVKDINSRLSLFKHYFANAT